MAISSNKKEYELGNAGSVSFGKENLRRHQVPPTHSPLKSIMSTKSDIGKDCLSTSSRLLALHLALHLIPAFLWSSMHNTKNDLRQIYGERYLRIRIRTQFK